MDLNIFSTDSGIYRITEWISRLVYANLLWVLFTLLGLGVFGIMPATLGLFAVINKWLNGQENFPVFREYWKNYKGYFWRINLLGLIMFAIGAVLYIDLEYFQDARGALYQLIEYLFYLFIFLYLIDLIYIFPLFLKYDIKLRYIIKNALFFALLAPAETVKIILGLAVITLLFWRLPSLLPFLAVSLPVFLISWFSGTGIEKVEGKIRENRNSGF
ncbi:MAG: YesL family protein [Halanaerobiaceae bacterium]|nr:YesL family protein [Halanaerobiaceae bacterium]